MTRRKIDIFVLVTTRPIPYSGQCVCMRNCVGVFGMDTGQPLVTSNRMGNYLKDHHKVYYTYIGIYIQKYNNMHYYIICHMDIRENF